MKHSDDSGAILPGLVARRVAETELIGIGGAESFAAVKQSLGFLFNRWSGVQIRDDLDII